MAQLQFDCPHCHTPRVAFTLGGFMKMPNTVDMFIALMQCGICEEGIVAKIGGDVGRWQNSGQRIIRVIDVYPREIAPAAPDNVPTNVASFYLQGLDSLARGNFDAAGSMFRKSLDTALKALHPEGKGTLEKRIDGIPSEKGITPAMKSWAHEMRHLGNDAAHDVDPFTKPDAETLQAFTELFLTYAFTLPGMMALRKGDPAG